MFSSSRATHPSRKPPARSTGKPGLRQPPAAHTLPPPTQPGRISPAGSEISAAVVASKMRSPTHLAGNKRKERDFELDACQETNINVVVRCRGRNDREVRENSGVVVETNGIKGNTVELSMGPNAVSNKAYHFDKVFSPAADQSMVFDEVVAPILEEVLSGFNCTIFAYGQTGTGKTYTMSGDMTDILPLPDAAGIIPRVMYSLFDKLDNAEIESSVKCSFIELYNEELKDLLSADESKLKIYDDANKKREGATLVQGMEETYIKSASKGLELLRLGSHRRQVAATKCNDLSSRSHTVFTMTVFVKRLSETGEELVGTGKLNLVDLAGSENIQRSGAENKRAAEAGLINKSLLTLGRVINALVDKNRPHVPYRESKLTRLLQDSLGGRTKTCIIATLSPAKSNLEETISTLDYAFRAKNIRNKPQSNQPLSKKTLIREFTVEIEKLKSELIATRQRNGVYLTTDLYEEITTESESRRILSEEQRDKIGTMEKNLRNKVQELFSLTGNFSGLKKSHDATKASLDSTVNVLQETEIILEHTRRCLAEETVLRKAHQAAEENLATIGSGLLSTLGKTTTDISGLHDRVQRESNLRSKNLSTWQESSKSVTSITTEVDHRLKAFEGEQQRLMMDMSSRLNNFVKKELEEIGSSKTSLSGKAIAFDESEKAVSRQAAEARDNLNDVLEEIKCLREDVKHKVGEGLDSLSAAAQRISAGVVTELESFQSQLHESYTSLGKEFRNTFDELVKDLRESHNESKKQKNDLINVTNALAEANSNSSSRISQILREEKEIAARERDDLVASISALIKSNGDTQEGRLEFRVNSLRDEMALSNTRYEEQQAAYSLSSEALYAKEQTLIDQLLKSRENVKAKIKKDWTAANEQNATIQATTRSVHEETIRIVDEQMKNMDIQLQSLNDIVSQMRNQNSQHHDTHVQSLSFLGSTVKESYQSIQDHLDRSAGRCASLDQLVSEPSAAVLAETVLFEASLLQHMQKVRSGLEENAILDYVATGETPQRMQYIYAQSLPRTRQHQDLIAEFRGVEARDVSNDSAETDVRRGSPTKTLVFADEEIRGQDHSEPVLVSSSPVRLKCESRPESADGGLRELDVNVAPSANRVDGVTTVQLGVPLSEAMKLKSSAGQQQQQPPPFKRQNTGTKYAQQTEVDFSASLGSKLSRRNAAEGRENVPLGASLNASGRVLRNRGT